MAQALCAGDRAKRVEFRIATLQYMKDDNFLPRLISSDEATFYINDKVNHHNALFMGTRKLQEILEHHSDFRKVNVF